MLSNESIEFYRKMTPGERLTLTLKMMRENTPCFFEGSPDVIQRRIKYIETENQARNENMLRAIAKSKHLHE